MSSRVGRRTAQNGDVAPCCGILAVMSAVALRPLGVGEVLDVGIKIWTKNLWTLFRLVLLIVLPVEIVAGLILLSAPSSSGSASNGYLAAAFLAAILGAVASTLATAACFKAVADAYLGHRADWRTSLGFVSRRVPSVLWVTALVYLFTGLALLLLVIPGIWLWVSYTVAVPALLLEGVRGRAALKRSRQLVRGRWWPTFGVLLLGSILTGVASLVISGAISALSAAGVGSDSLAGVIASTAGNTVAKALTTPLTSAFVIVLYFDFRVRKEGFDLQLLAERIGLAPVAAGALYPAPQPAAEPGPSSGALPPFWPPPPDWRPAEEPERR